MQQPMDLQSFLNLIASQAFIGILLSWIIDHIPFMQNAAVANYKKLSFALLVCILWVVVSTYIQQGALPHDANGVYIMLMTAVAVIFTNQAAYKLIDNIPALRDFFLALAGKATTATVTMSTSGSVGASTSLVVNETNTGTPAAKPPAEAVG